MQQEIEMTETIEKKKSVARTEENDPREERCKQPVSRNLLAKKQMAEQLMTMGLSIESIARILHLRLKDERS